MEPVTTRMLLGYSNEITQAVFRVVSDQTDRLIEAGDIVEAVREAHGLPSVIRHHRDFEVPRLGLTSYDFWLDSEDNARPLKKVMSSYDDLSVYLPSYMYAQNPNRLSFEFEASGESSEVLAHIVDLRCRLYDASKPDRDDTIAVFLGQPQMWEAIEVLRQKGLFDANQEASGGAPTYELWATYVMDSENRVDGNGGVVARFSNNRSNLSYSCDILEHCILDYRLIAEQEREEVAKMIEWERQSHKLPGDVLSVVPQNRR